MKFELKALYKPDNKIYEILSIDFQEGTISVWRDDGSQINDDLDRYEILIERGDSGEKILGEDMNVNDLVDYVNINFPDEAKRCRILLAVVLKRLEKLENKSNTLASPGRER